MKKTKTFTLINEGETMIFVNAKYGLCFCQHFGNIRCELGFATTNEKERVKDLR